MMFTAARLKLTGWYLLIIMLVSVFFSLAIYVGINRELTRFEHIAQIRRQRESRLVPNISPQSISEARGRLILILVLINTGILGVSAVAGYFLAGKTLAPIAEMVTGQKHFIADASHELRTPLASMRSEAEVALRDKSLTLAEARTLLASNLEEVESLQVLTDNLIRLTQYQRPDESFSFEKVSLKMVALEASKRVAVMARKKAVKVRNETGDLEITVDKNSFSELLTILLDNAIKYSPRGGEVFLSGRNFAGQVVVEVRDRGVGIAKEEISHLFDRFYRGDKSRTNTGVSGYGLGLAIAKEIVTRHHGTIRVESAVGRGTRVEVLISKRQRRAVV